MKHPPSLEANATPILYLVTSRSSFTLMVWHITLSEACPLLLFSSKTICQSCATGCVDSYSHVFYENDTFFFIPMISACCILQKLNGLSCVMWSWPQRTPARRHVLWFHSTINLFTDGGQSSTAEINEWAHKVCITLFVCLEAARFGKKEYAKSTYLEAQRADWPPRLAQPRLHCYLLKLCVETCLGYSKNCSEVRCGLLTCYFFRLKDRSLSKRLHL